MCSNNALASLPVCARSSESAHHSHIFQPIKRAHRGATRPLLAGELSLTARTGPLSVWLHIVPHTQMEPDMQTQKLFKWVLEKSATVPLWDWFCNPWLSDRHEHVVTRERGVAGRIHDSWALW